MSTTAKELIEAATPSGVLIAAAEDLKNRARQCGSQPTMTSDLWLANHILSTIRPDDDEPVTVEWVDLETPLVNRSTSPYSRNYLIRGGVRLAASARPGGFEPCVLWCGSANEFYEIGTPTRGDVRSLLRGLRVPTND